MYQDKLDGRITTALFDQKEAAWRDQQTALRHKMSELRTATLAPMDATSNACDLFTRQPPQEQRKLVSTVLERAMWKDGALNATVRTVRATAPLEPNKYQ